MESLRNETVVDNAVGLEIFSIRPRGPAPAIRRALVKEDREFAETRWPDAVSSLGSTSSRFGVRYRTRIVDSRVRSGPGPAGVRADPANRG